MYNLRPENQNRNSGDLATPRRYYDLPYQLAHLDRVAIVGAGSGNDAAAALRAGAAHVDAVEIDPAIVALGRAYHPEQPYSDPRVNVVVNDLMYYILDRWRDREVKLARANDIISRYVASQLAVEIQAGHFDAIERRERRKLTLFFSDIKDFAATADAIEPEDLSNMLDEYLSEMTAIGERYGATIDKFVGDAIMIFFGAPVATSDRDHAIRAVRMAIDMQLRMRELRFKWSQAGGEHPFQVRMGINTGQASIGNFGSKGRLDYTAIGRQVNLAARLQAECEPGKILISHSTWALVHDAIPCVPRGAFHVKGFHERVRVYEVSVQPGARRG